MPSLPKELTPEKDTKGEHGYSSSEWWLVYITIVLTAFTSGLMVYTAMLWGAGEKNAKRQLRGYLGIVSGKIKVLPDCSGYIAHVVIRNTGVTPAHNVRVSITSDILGADRDGTGLINPEMRRERWTMVQGSQWVIRHYRKFSDGNISAITNKKQSVFVWGEISYRDSFTEDCYVRYVYRDGDTVFIDEDPVSQASRGWELQPAEHGYTTEYGEETRT